jgi:hypothetical protein
MLRKLRRCVRFILDGAVEQLLNINTNMMNQSKEGQTKYKDNFWYESLSYLSLYNMLKPLRISPDDVVYDIGAGTGRILCFIGAKPVKRCVGIEFNPQLVRQA